MAQSTANKVVAFDLDDTLYLEMDYVRSAYRAIDSLMQNCYGFEGSYTILWHAYSRKVNPFDALIEAMPEGSKPTANLLVTTYRYHRPTIELSEGVELLLSSLTQRGITIAIITDGRSVSQRNKIEALGLLKYVRPENIIVSEETGHEKDHPFNFEKLASRFPAGTEFTYVGDNPIKDFHHPNLMGWHTIGIVRPGKVERHPNLVDSGDLTHDFMPQVITHSTEELANALSEIE